MKNKCRQMHEIQICHIRKSNEDIVVCCILHLYVCIIKYYYIKKRKISRIRRRK